VFVVGVDENGLGPRLGPLVATAAMLKVDSYRKDEFSEIGKNLGVNDSKATSGFGRMRAVEGISLALIERLYGRSPSDIDELLDLIALDSVDTLRSLCPSRSKEQCWSQPIALPAFGGQIEKGRLVLEQLDLANITIVKVESAVACASLLNREVRKLGSKFTVDLALFERLVLACRDSVSAEVEAYCGLVGGIRKYGRYFQHLRQRELETVEEIPGRSAYGVRGVGLLAFEVDADAYHLPVSLASMVGKYLRELIMERQNRYYLERDPLLRRVSGYHDPNTKDFIERSLPLRKRLGITKECFER
jgi:ribonuclease HII